MTKIMPTTHACTLDTGETAYLARAGGDVVAAAQEPAGVSRSLIRLTVLVDGVLAHIYGTPRSESSSVTSRFARLANQWRRQTEFESSITAKAMHPAYQQIIGMGPEVLPLILGDLREHTDHWFWALKAISGEDPVPIQHRGRVHQMRDCWLQWGRAKGLVSD